MVTCFESVAFDAASTSKAQTMASGIRVALFTTAGGLIVAIPSLMILFLSNLRLNSVVSECETYSEQFIHQIAVIKRRESATGNKENKEAADVAELAAATD